MATACGQWSWYQWSEEPQALAIVRTPHDKETMSDGCHHLTAANGISAALLVDNFNTGE